ncbi:MAG: DUF1461 domain-containing protein [Dehalococcoidales bacterium]|nr:DUF1461 domain-containing protein [Dehalococcoidales bacterium]
MKILTIIARGLFIICVPVLAFNITISWAVNSTDFYTHRFEKYDVRQSLADNGLSFSAADMKIIAREFIRYFNSSEELIHLIVMQDGKTIVEVFNNEEILHFKDVKGLFRLNYYLLAGTFAYCLAFALTSIFRGRGKYRLELAWSTLTGSALTLGIMLLLGIGIWLDFDHFFYQFHLISFSNDYWSAAGNMLLLFPLGFWYDAIIYCAVTIALIAIVLGAVSGIYLSYHRKKGEDVTPSPDAAGGP